MKLSIVCLNKVFIILLVFLSPILNAQEPWKNTDFVYQEYIRTVTLLPDETVVAMSSFGSRLKSQSSLSGRGLRMDSIRQRNQIADIPIIALQGGTILLSFDDLEGGFKYYRYKIEYCNADWSPSSLSEMEVIQGYAEDRLPDGRQSFGMTSDFTNYHLLLPNKSTTFLKSGNYLLHIYIDDADNTKVLTRRFCVFERMLFVDAKFTPTGKTEKTNTHQELDVTATYKNINIKNPQREIKLTVVQNSNWNTAKYNIRPNTHIFGTLGFDFQDSIVFPAGKEYRPFDIRNLNFQRLHIQQINSFEDGYDVTLIPDYPLGEHPYRFYFDINGGYVNDNMDITNNDAPEIKSEYPNVLFTLKTEQPFEGKDVYLLGKISDWQAYEWFKLSYDAKRKAYFIDVPIKQGYYDYAYGLVDKHGNIDLASLEGNWYETENNYSLLLYYRPIGDRFDRLIGYNRVNSLLNR
jgi:hypothetical protein